MKIYVYGINEIPGYTWIGINPILVNFPNYNTYYKSFIAGVNVTSDWYFNDFPYANDLSNIIFVDSAQEADYIIFPYTLDEVMEREGIRGTVAYINSLKYYGSFSDKHVFMMWHDLSSQLNIRGILFKTGVNKFVKKSNEVVIAYPVKDFVEDLHFDNSKIIYDICFVGCHLTHPLRKVSVTALSKCKSIKSFISTLDDFFGRATFNSIRTDRIQLFKDSILNSALAFCPRGRNENCIRFFEILSLGRCPVIIGDSCTLPFEDKIDWSNILFKIPEHLITEGKLEGHLRQMLDLGVDALLERGKLARSTWEQYFSPKTLLRNWWDVLERMKK